MNACTCDYVERDDGTYRLQKRGCPTHGSWVNTLSSDTRDRAEEAQ